MNIKKLLDLARQHVEEIAAKNADAPAPAYLSHDIVLSQLDDDDTTSLESILSTFFTPSDDRLSFRVSYTTLSFFLSFSHTHSLCLYYLRRPATLKL